MRPVGEMELVKELTGAGVNASEIARRTGIPLSTVRGWRNGRITGRGRMPRPDLAALPGWTYAYLLGTYLGDGHVSAWKKGLYHLRIFCDTAYPGIVLEVQNAMRAVRPDGSVHLVRRAAGTCTVVQNLWRDWPILFPQHGPGPKHERQIGLEGWQLEYTHAHPEALIRGLIHSDGCRYIARQRCGEKIYTYERYGFTNKSQDIRTIFTDHLRLLGVHYVQSGPEQIDVNRRKDVARLDEFVGPKS